MRRTGSPLRGFNCVSWRSSYMHVTVSSTCCDATPSCCRAELNMEGSGTLWPERQDWRTRSKLAPSRERRRAGPSAAAVSSSQWLASTAVRSPDVTEKKTSLRFTHLSDFISPASPHVTAGSQVMSSCLLGFMWGFNLHHLEEISEDSCQSFDVNNQATSFRFHRLAKRWCWGARFGPRVAVCPPQLCMFCVQMCWCSCTSVTQTGSCLQHSWLDDHHRLSELLQQGCDWPIRRQSHSPDLSLLHNLRLQCWDHLHTHSHTRRVTVKQSCKEEGGGSKSVEDSLTSLTWERVVSPLSARLAAPCFCDVTVDRKPLKTTEWNEQRTTSMQQICANQIIWSTCVYTWQRNVLSLQWGLNSTPCCLNLFLSDSAPKGNSKALNASLLQKTSNCSVFNTDFWKFGHSDVFSLHGLTHWNYYYCSVILLSFTIFDILFFSPSQCSTNTSVWLSLLQTAWLCLFVSLCWLCCCSRLCVSTTARPSMTGPQVEKWMARSGFLCLFLVFFKKKSLCHVACSSLVQFPLKMSPSQSINPCSCLSLLGFSLSLFLRQYRPDSGLWRQHDHARSQPVHGSVGRLQHHRLGSEREPQHHRVPGLRRHQRESSNHPLPAACEPQSG